MTSRHPLLRHLPLLIGIGLSIGVALLVYWLKDHFHKGPQMKRVVQQIAVIPPPATRPPSRERPPWRAARPKPSAPALPFPSTPSCSPEPADEPPGEQLGV